MQRFKLRLKRTEAPPVAEDCEEDDFDDVEGMPVPRPPACDGAARVAEANRRAAKYTHAHARDDADATTTTGTTATTLDGDILGEYNDATPSTSSKAGRSYDENCHAKCVSSGTTWRRS